MRPAWSVIVFSTLSGAGYGLLCWAALSALLSLLPARPLLVSMLLALVLVTIGLLSSLAHLGQPRRAWRAFSQWRTSWLSREGVAATLTYVPALLFVAMLLPGMISANTSGEAIHLNASGVLACALLIACAIATVVCTAMIYACLKPVPAWRHRLVVPAYLLFALASGGLLLAAVASASGATPGIAAIAPLAMLVVVLALLKLRYWRDLDAAALPATRGAAVGLPQRTATVFERPSTEANYITREMAFVLARKHARRLRQVALVGFALVPVAGLAMACFSPVYASPWLALSALSALVGALVERWLFFAQAKHLVTLYY